MNVVDNVAAISQIFVDARISGHRVDIYPGDMPQNLAAAYEIQDAAIALHPFEIGGWKVGRIPPGQVAELGAERLAGPIFSHQIEHAIQDGLIEMPLLPGFAAAEAEMLLRIGKQPPPFLDAATAHDYVDEVRFGLEIASSPYAGINLGGAAVTVSDFGNNFGLVLGPEITDWQHIDLMKAKVEIFIDDKTIGTGRLADMLDGPFGSVAFVNNLLNERGMTLKPGDWISTGAITGVHEIAVGQTAHASFDKTLTVGCKTIAYNKPEDR